MRTRSAWSSAHHVVAPDITCNRDRTAMRAITEKCPKFKTPYAQRFAEKGFAAAKAGKPLDALDDESDPDFEDTTWQPGGRMAWLSGWEYGGGDIHRRIVVPQRLRLEERRAALLKDLEWVEQQLSAVPTSEQP